MRNSVKRQTDSDRLVKSGQKRKKKTQPFFTTPHESPHNLEIFSPEVRLRFSDANGGRGSRVVKVSDHSWPCQEFEPSTTKDPPCRGAMRVKFVENSNVLPLVWCGSLEREVPVQVSSTSFDRGPSPRTLMWLGDATSLTLDDMKPSLKFHFAKSRIVSSFALHKRTYWDGPKSDLIEFKSFMGPSTSSPRSDLS
ncbi:hypothetical protein TNCV_1119201 [Trichonephila clavipes]|uniref:Uncharacterized protein n=1 Tax=Trichonephila clavipes TaxID=2585209 RepID=A0A8X6SYV1_TRICX|nr:hypothetical protein TNCV_1119201 [Trichonephila clavipes]